MSTANHSGATVPTKEFTVNLDAHGFEPDPEAPAEVSADLVRDTNGTYALEIQSEGNEQRWRVELQPDPKSGDLEPLHAYENGCVIASAEDSNTSGISEIEQWLRFVIRHVSAEVTPGR